MCGWAGVGHVEPVGGATGVWWALCGEGGEQGLDKVSY